MVASCASLGFLVSLDSSVFALPVVLALLVGGSIAAPIAAWLVRWLHPRILGAAVGGLIVLTNGRTLLNVDRRRGQSADRRLRRPHRHLVRRHCVVVRGVRLERRQTAPPRPDRHDAIRRVPVPSESPLRSWCERVAPVAHNASHELEAAHRDVPGAEHASRLRVHRRTLSAARLAAAPSWSSARRSISSVTARSTPGSSAVCRTSSSTRQTPAPVELLAAPVHQRRSLRGPPDLLLRCHRASRQPRADALPIFAGDPGPTTTWIPTPATT